MVVGHHGEFVGGQIVPPPDHKVAKVYPRRAAHRPLQGVVKLDRPPIGHSKPPRHAAGIADPVPRCGPQCGRKDRLGVGVCYGVAGEVCWRMPARSRPAARAFRFVRGVGSLIDVAAGVGARVDHPGRLELSPDLAKPRRPFALHVRGVGAAEVGPFGPVEAEPAEIFAGGGGVFGPAAWSVEVFDPEHEPGPAGPLGGEGERPRVARVKVAGGRRCDASAEWHAVHYRSGAP